MGDVKPRFEKRCNTNDLPNDLGKHIKFAISCGEKYLNFSCCNVFPLDTSS